MRIAGREIGVVTVDLEEEKESCQARETQLCCASKLNIKDPVAAGNYNSS